ncbi:putative tetratricopeptide-like helical domain superfamily [Dioscorea sansibarensis]
MSMQETLDSDPSNPSHHFNLGLLFWRRGEEAGGDESKELKGRAAEHFLASAKLNPSDGASFRLLGHYYSRVSLDVQRASKCYQRAVSLDPEDFEAGEALCELLDASGKESLEVSTCREIAEKSRRAFWAFRRLGYLQVHQKKWLEAVQSLQHAIRGYPTCADLWEALGLAYHRLGMFTAALKSYGRAIELENSRIFALIQSGNIQLMLGSYKKGVEQFRCALDIAPHNISAQLGLASGLLGLSKDCVNSGAFGWGAALLEEASTVVEAGTHLTGNMFSAWKLHGDIKIAYAKCFPWEGERICREMNEETFSSSISDWKKTCHLAAVSARKSYQRALHLVPWQANIYTDISIALDLIGSLEESFTADTDVWHLPEKMSVGGLMLEGANSEFWIILGCVSHSYPLQQHAFIRALQLDGSQSAAWAFLGKLYRMLGDKQLARQAFDHARSIDPSLALPWAGMSVESSDGKYSVVEAHESCQLAAQILPLPEFQVGLGMLAARSGQLLSPQVFGAVRQAVQRAPFYAESHNLKGLVYEARRDYEAATVAYKCARWAFSTMHIADPAFKSCLTDVSINLARSLCQAGHANDAVRECEALRINGTLNTEGFQIYAFALWQLGRNDEVLALARTLISNVPTMEQRYAVSALGLVCKLIYFISGQHSVSAVIQKLPKELLRNKRMGFIVAALTALDRNSQLQVLLSSLLQTVKSQDAATELHSIVAISKMMTNGSKQILEIENGLKYLRNVLHVYPSSSLIRYQLSSLLLSNEDWMASERAIKCSLAATRDHVNNGLKSPFEIHGAVRVACYAGGATCPKFSFPTCKDLRMRGTMTVQHLQKWLRQEPWNYKARYLLILNIYQKAREEKFPQYLCTTLKRLLVAALSQETYLKESGQYQYQKFLLLLCASEISLQLGDHIGCFNWTKTALGLAPSNSDLFFAHLQLCRAYAAQDDLPSVRNEYTRCLQLKTANLIGWISLKYLESRYKLQENSSAVDINFESCIALKMNSKDIWGAIFNLVCAQGFVHDQDLFHAEGTLMRVCAEENADSCLLLFHGAVCMELARQQSGSQFLLRAAASLTKAMENAPVPLPIISALLAQAEASLGARTKWESNLRLEWCSWPPEMRPAELYFQMSLLARQPNKGSNQNSNVELSQSSEKWLLRAIHLNPSCLRYWRVLQKLIMGS